MSASGIRAGRAFVEIGANDKLTAALSAAQAKMKAFADGAMGVGRQLATMGVTASIPFALSAATFASFDDAMRSVGAVSRATDAELQAMTATAAELGRTTSFTAVQVGALMTELGRAGFSPAQIQAMTKAVLDLSRATGTEAPMAAGIMSASIRQFGLQATDAARVSDVLTMAANATFNTVEALGEALKYAGPVAADLGMSFEETVAVLGTLGNVGIQGSEAGTALRQLNVIAAATGEDLKRIFGVSNVDASGNLKPLVAVLDEINKATQDMPIEERVAKMDEAFGLLGITAASVMGKAGASTTELLAKLQNAAGVADQTAKKMDAGIGGAFRIFMSALEGVANSIGKAIEGPVMAFAAIFARAMGSVTSWIDSHNGAVATVAMLTAGMVTAGAAVLGFGIAMKATAMVIGGVTTVMQGVTWTIGAVSTVMKLVAVSSLLLQGAMALSSGSVIGLGLAMNFLNMAQAISPGLTALASGAFGALATVLGITSGAGAATAGTATVAGGAWAAAGASAAAAWAAALVPLLPFVAAAAAIAAVVAMVAGVLVIAATKAGAFAAVWRGTKVLFGELLGIVKTTFGGIMSALQAGQYVAAAQILWLGVKAAFWNGTAIIAAGVVDFFENFLDNAKAFGKSLLTTLWDVFTAVPRMIWKALTSGGSIAEIISEALSGGSGDFLKGLEGNAAASTAAMNEKIKQTQEAAKATQILADQEAKLKALRDEKSAKDKAAQTPAQAEDLAAKERDAVAAGGDGSVARYDSNAAEIERLQKELGYTKDQPGALPTGGGGASNTSNPDPDAVKAIQDRTAALANEAIESRLGADAAERLKFAMSGATEEQKKAFEAAMNAPDGTEMMARAEMVSKGATEAQLAVFDAAVAAKHATDKGVASSKALAIATGGVTAAQMDAYNAALAAKQAAAMQSQVDERIKSLQEETYELQHGANAAERFKLGLMGATAEQLAALKVAQDQADAAKKNAELAQDGQSLRDSLRTPLEIFRDEMAKVRELVDAGAIDTNTADRAKNKNLDELARAADTEAKRKEMFNAERQRIDTLAAEGKISAESAQQQMSVIAALLEEAKRRAEAAGDKMTKMNNLGESSGFAVARMLGSNKGNVQDRIANAAEENVKETREFRKSVEKRKARFEFVD